MTLSTISTAISQSTLCGMLIPHTEKLGRGMQKLPYWVEYTQSTHLWVNCTFSAFFYTTSNPMPKCHGKMCTKSMGSNMTPFRLLAATLVYCMTMLSVTLFYKMQLSLSCANKCANSLLLCYCFITQQSLPFCLNNTTCKWGVTSSAGYKQGVAQHPLTPKCAQWF